MKKFLALTLALLMVFTILPVSALAEFDTSASNDYYVVISENEYKLAPGATETELIVNNKEGSDRKVVHYFEVDPKNETLEVLPGYYGIDKLDPDNLALDGIVDKKQYWKAEQLTKTVAYYEGLGYNVVGGMNTALAYDSDAPYGYMVMNGVVLGTPEVHKGAQTYLAIDAEGNCELRSMSTPLDGSEVTAISANFGWLVKDGALQKTAVERTSSDASRSMIGIKADGSLIFCQVDGRNAPLSTGLSDYEMGEMMLSLGCVNAVNCDGGGSSTFVSKREGETANTMRSVPSDGSERATINSVILVSNAKATGEFDHAVLDAEYDYYAPGSSAAMEVIGVDAAGSIAKLPEEGITWALSDASFGTVKDGVFTSTGKKGDVTVQMIYNDAVVGEKAIHVVDPDVFALTMDETVLPYGKEMTIDFACTYGVDDWAVCVDGAYSLALSDNNAATLNGNVLKATTDESILGVDVTATYIPNPAVTDILKVEYGKGSEILYDFEDGDRAGFVGFDEAKQYSIDNGINNTLVGSAPLGGQYSDEADGSTFVASKEKGQPVKSGNYALAWNADYSYAAFASWTYNILFNIGETIVLRDVANGKFATTLGMWLYIPEGAAGLAFQSQFYTKNADGSYVCKQDHFMFTTVSGVRKNLNSCTEADIPESRWVYASIDISKYDYLCTPVANETSNSRSPSFIRTYVKPNVPANHTFYIDDITLDYSSAVDDRVLPTISNINYTTADEGVAFENGATINGTNVAFSAIVSDNVKLDAASGKIVVDGNEIASAKISGKYLACETTALLPGAHTVAFEVKDTLGNLARVTRTFTIAGDAPIVLSGHNDSGAKPEIDSVYYVDLNVADITAVNKVTASLQLQDANTFEPQGLVVADGFKATYTLDEVEQILHITIERNGEDLDVTATTLVSIPARLWSWKAINHITGKPIAPEAQYATGNNPIVTVDCKVINGFVELANTNGAFGGSISVETMINDIVYPWHTHDAELTAVADKEATCMVNGYTGRTYCATCQSVIDWGTTVEAPGHNYKNGNCTECGKEYNYTGLLEKDGNWYYLVGGVEASGWQMIGSDWYYFDTTTKIGAEGELVLFSNITYTFENGKLTSGVWAKTLFGMRYYYGPGCYNDRGSWRNIDGKDYFFVGSYRVEGGWQLVYENQINRNWYYFKEDGSCDKSVKPADGFYTDRNGYAYAKDGQGLAGLHFIDGKAYYFDHKGYAQKNGVYANFLFKDDYAGYTGLHEKDGVKYLYVNGRTASYGLYEIDGKYYYSYWGGVLQTDGRYYIGTTYCDLPVGEYSFDENGEMLNGVVEVDGKQYLYFNGTTGSHGLYKVGDDYYFSDWGGVLKTNGKYYVGKTYCDLPVGNYQFGADGKMLNGVANVNGTLYLYINGNTATHGLYKVGDDYYFSDWGGVLKVDGRYYAGRTFCDLPVGNYSFDADGKMLDGVVDIDGTLYLYIKGTTATYGLYKIDGEYYYSYWGGVLKVDGKHYVGTSYCDLPAGEYVFDEEGKMRDGVENIDGTLYLYINGRTATYGLYKIDGEYYYSYWGGVIKTNGRYYVGTTFCDLPIGEYSFDADGTMLNGVEEVNDTLYLYFNGTTASHGLYKVGDDYYFSDWGGVLKTNGKYYAGKTYCDLPVGNYEFGADGKMYNGFVTIDGVKYYYKNGNTPRPGMIEVDGDYYFVNWSGVVVTDCVFYVWEGNGYTVAMNYTFDSEGRVVR